MSADGCKLVTVGKDTFFKDINGNTFLLVEVE